MQDRPGKLKLGWVRRCGYFFENRGRRKLRENLEWMAVPGAKDERSVSGDEGQGGSDLPTLQAPRRSTGHEG